MASKAILLVEDEEDVRDLITAYLEALGYGVFPVINPQEALVVLANADTPVDLVITDELMPEGTGTQIVVYMSQHCRNTPVIRMSGGSIPYHPPPPRSTRIEKPIDLAHLKVLIEEFLPQSGGETTALSD